MTTASTAGMAQPRKRMKPAQYGLVNTQPTIFQKPDTGNVTRRGLTLHGLFPHNRAPSRLFRELKVTSSSSSSSQASCNKGSSSVSMSSACTKEQRKAVSRAKASAHVSSAVWCCTNVGANLPHPSEQAGVYVQSPPLHPAAFAHRPLQQNGVTARPDQASVFSL